MIELVLTITLSTFVIITFRLINRFHVDELEAIAVNYLFAFGWAMVVWREVLPLGEFTAKPWFALSAVIGVLFIVTFFLMSRSTVSAGIAITAVASRMSVVIPVVAGFLIFHDRVSALKLAGILLCLLSFYLIFRPKVSVKINASRIVVPFFLFLGIGANDTIMKYIQVHYLEGDESLMLGNVFLISLVISLVVLVFRNIKSPRQFTFKSLLAGSILGTCNFGATYFFVRSMMRYESAVLFPVVNAGIVMLSALTGLIFFRENLSRLNWIGIFTAMIAILIISST